MINDGCCQSVRRGAVLCYVVCSLLFERTLIYYVCVCVRLLFIDTHFKTLRLTAQDSAGRQHALTVKLKSKVRWRLAPVTVTTTTDTTKPQCSSVVLTLGWSINRSSGSPLEVVDGTRPFHQFISESFLSQILCTTVVL